MYINFKIKIIVIVFLLLLNLLLPLASFTQCPNPDFTVKGTVCLNESSEIQNISTGADLFEWDFCVGDILNTPGLQASNLLNDANVPLRLDIVTDENNWFAFVTSRSNSKMFRIDFGNSLKNIPTDVQEILVSGTALNEPDAFKIVKEGGKWYALVLNTKTTNRELIRLTFGTSLTNVTPESNLLLAPFGSVNSGFSVRNDKGNLVLVLANNSTNRLNLLNFGNSILNSVTSANQIIMPSAITGASALTDIDLFYQCNSWVGLITSTSNGAVHKLSFGSNLFTIPVISDITNNVIASATPVSSVTLSQLTAVNIRQEGNHVIAFLNSQSAKVVRVIFSDLSLNTISSSSMFSLPGTTLSRGFRIVNEKSNWYAFTLNNSNKTLYKYIFPESCIANILFSNEITPPIFKFSAAGNYSITLRTFDEYNNPIIKDKKITVTEAEPPFLDILNKNECVESIVEFIPSITNSQSISSYSWEFGDPSSGSNNTSTAENPSHQFTAPGVYKVKLSVTSTNGCSNIFIKSDTIYQETNPDFSAPTGMICSGQPIKFDTLFSGYTGRKVRWLWNFGDGQTSTEKYPTHIYQTGGIYNVSLTAGVTGCSNTVTLQITVTQGANSDFSFESICLDDATQFRDISTGAAATSWLWDFGDGNQSTLRHPNNVFAEVGNYNVSLTVQSASGCVTTKTKLVRIFSNPVVDFTHGLLCSSDSIQFADNSTLSDANIIGWDWEVYNDQSELIHEKSGKNIVNFYFSSPGKYFVSLTATSESGCKSIKTTEIDIVASPQVDIDLNGTCVGDLITLEGVSKDPSQEIVDWKWTIDNGPYISGKSITHTFLASRKYQVSMVATALNGCETFIVKEYHFFAKPSVSFAVSNSCVNLPTQFFDNSTVTNGNIVKWHWDFGGLGSSELQNPVFTFANADNLDITLTTTTTENCSATLSRNIKINEIPEAAFSSSCEDPETPLKIQFRNLSSNSKGFKWDFGNGASSEEENPIYTFSEFGNYPVQLIAFNEGGCADTLSQVIPVTQSTAGVSLENLIGYTLINEVVFTVEIRNTGNSIVNNLDLSIEFGGQIALKEVWEGELKPGDKITYNLTNSLLKHQVPKVKYLCLKIRSMDGKSPKSNGKICINLVDNFTVFGPTPNPARSEVTLSYILPQEKVLEVNIYSGKGEKIPLKVSNSNQGFNEQKIDISTLTPGVYVIEFNYDKLKERKKLLIY